MFIFIIYLVTCAFMYYYFYDMIFEEDDEVDAVQNVTAFITALIYPVVIVNIIVVMIYRLVTNR